MAAGDDPEPPPAGRRVTRRHVLVAGTVAAVRVAAAGGWAVIETVPSVRRRLHAAGLLDGPDRAVPDVADIPAVAYGGLDAPDGRRYRWGRWAPEGGEPELCLVCLHPKGGDEPTPFRTLGVHRFVADAGLPWAVASLAGGDDYWHPRADGADPLGALTDGLLPMLAPPRRALRGAGLVDERLRGAAAGRATPGWPGRGGGQQPGGVGVVRRGGIRGVRRCRRLPGPRRSGGGRCAASRTGRAGRLRGGRRVRGDQSPLLEAVPGVAGGIHPGFHDEGTWRSFLPAQIGWIGSGR